MASVKQLKQQQVSNGKRTAADFDKAGKNSSISTKLSVCHPMQAEHPQSRFNTGVQLSLFFFGAEPKLDTLSSAMTALMCLGLYALRHQDRSQTRV